MSFFWPDNDKAPDEETRKLYGMRRKVYLGCVILVALVCFETVLFTSTGTGPIWLRIFNYMLCAYALGLVVYATAWFIKSWTQTRRQEANAYKDRLTGFLNRPGLLKAIHNQWSDPERGLELRFIYVKLRGLEQCNNAHGEATGDRVLTETAEILREESPRGCTFGRVTGAEFVILLRCNHLQTARQLTARIEERIENHDFVTGDVQIKVRTAMAADVSGAQTLRGVLSDVRLQAAGCNPHIEDSDEKVFHPLPQVSLEACARFDYNGLEPTTRNELFGWKKYQDGEFLERMAQDVVELLSFRAGNRPFDFVTSPPANGSSDEKNGLERLGKRVADLLEAPYRRVMVVSSLSPSTDEVEPKVAAPVDDGAYVLLVSDLVEHSRYLRRCVQKLSRAGAIVQPIAWATKI